MSDVESKATPEVQTEAQRMGWIPAERYKGDPDKFVDADDYIRRGQEVLPIVRSQLASTRSELSTVQSELASTRAALEAATRAIEDIQEQNTIATQRAVDDAKKDVKRQLTEALESGDHEAVAELTGKMVELNAAKAEAPPKVEPTKAEVVPKFLQEWAAENPWYNTDPRRRSLAIGIAEDLRRNNEPSTGRAFFDLVADEVNKVMPFRKNADEDGTPAPSRVASSRGSGSAGGGAPRAKSYGDLPAEAKAACDADAKRFAGPGKRYKTVDEWRNNYATIYFKDE